MSRGTKVQVKCKWCKEEFEARVADRKRGWAKYCSKSCKAKDQEKITGQYRAYLNNQPINLPAKRISKFDKLETYASHNNDGTFVYINGFGCWDDHKD